MEDKYIIIKVKSSYPLTEDEIQEQILEAEIAMNLRSKLRFHLAASIIEPEEMRKKFPELF